MISVYVHNFTYNVAMYILSWYYCSANHEFLNISQGIPCRNIITIMCRCEHRGMFCPSEISFSLSEHLLEIWKRQAWIPTLEQGPQLRPFPLLDIQPIHWTIGYSGVESSLCLQLKQFCFVYKLKNSLGQRDNGCIGWWLRQSPGS